MIDYLDYSDNIFICGSLLFKDIKIYSRQQGTVEKITE